MHKAEVVVAHLPKMPGLLKVPGGSGGKGRRLSWRAESIEDVQEFDKNLSPSAVGETRELKALANEQVRGKGQDQAREAMAKQREKQRHLETAEETRVLEEAKALASKECLTSQEGKARLLRLNLPALVDDTNASLRKDAESAVGDLRERLGGLEAKEVEKKQQEKIKRMEQDEKEAEERASREREIQKAQQWDRFNQSVATERELRQHQLDVFEKRRCREHVTTSSTKTTPASPQTLLWGSSKTLGVLEGIRKGAHSLALPDEDHLVSSGDVSEQSFSRPFLVSIGHKQRSKEDGFDDTLSSVLKSYHQAHPQSRPEGAQQSLSRRRCAAVSDMGSLLSLDLMNKLLDDFAAHKTLSWDIKDVSSFQEVFNQMLGVLQLNAGHFHASQIELARCGFENFAATFTENPDSTGHLVSNCSLPPIVEVLLSLLSSVYAPISEKATTLFGFLTKQKTTDTNQTPQTQGQSNMRASRISVNKNTVPTARASKVSLPRSSLASGGSSPMDYTENHAGEIMYANRPSLLSYAFACRQSLYTRPESSPTADPKSQSSRRTSVMSVPEENQAGNPSRKHFRTADPKLARKSGYTLELLGEDEIGFETVLELSVWMTKANRSASAAAVFAEAVEAELLEMMSRIGAKMTGSMCLAEADFLRVMCAFGPSCQYLSGGSSIEEPVQVAVPEDESDAAASATVEPLLLSFGLQDRLRQLAVQCLPGVELEPLLPYVNMDLLPIHQPTNFVDQQRKFSHNLTSEESERRLLLAKHWQMLFEKKLGKRTLEYSNFEILHACFVFECGIEQDDPELRKEALAMCKHAASLFHQMLGGSTRGCFEAYVQCATLHLRNFDWLASAEHFLIALNTESFAVASSQSEYLIAKTFVGLGQAFEGFGNFDAATYCFEQAESAMSMIRHPEHPSILAVQKQIADAQKTADRCSMTPSPVITPRMRGSYPTACEFLTVRFQRGPGADPTTEKAVVPRLVVPRRGRFQRRRKHCSFVNGDVAQQHRCKRSVVLEIKRGLALKADVPRRVFSEDPDGVDQVLVIFPTPSGSDAGLFSDAELSVNTVTVQRNSVENGPAVLLVNMKHDGQDHQKAFTVDWYHGCETKAKNQESLNFVNVNERMSGVEQVGLWCRLSDGSVFQNPSLVEETPVLKRLPLRQVRLVQVPFPAQWQAAPWQCRLWKSSWVPILRNPRDIAGDTMSEVLGLSLNFNPLSVDSRVAKDKSKKWATTRRSTISKNRLRFVSRRSQFVAGSPPPKSPPGFGFNSPDFLQSQFPLPIGDKIQDSAWRFELSQLSQNQTNLV